MGNLQVIGNPRLTDISALESFFDCNNVTTPLAAIGAVEVIPTVNPDPQSIISCLLGTVNQVKSKELPGIHGPHSTQKVLLAMLSNDRGAHDEMASAQLDNRSQ